MVALATGLAIAGGASKLIGMADSAISQRRLERQLKDLNKTPMARYSISPEIENLYRQSIGEASNPRGFGGAAYSGFRKNLGGIQRGRFANAMNMSGGSGSRAINAVLGGQELDALGNYYTADENIRRGNRQSALGRSQGFASQFQRTRDMNTSNDINYRQNLERAIGGGIASQKSYRNNMLGGLGSDLITSGFMQGFGGGGNGVEAGGGNAMAQTDGSDYLYSQSGRNSMMNRRNRFRDLGAYN